MSRYLEKEDAYQLWKQTEEELAEWYGEAVMSDFCEEGDMKKPTRVMIQETIIPEIESSKLARRGARQRFCGPTYGAVSWA